MELKGSLDGHGLRLAIVVARFNPMVTSKLLQGAKEALVSHGVKEEDIDIAWVPGSFEIPLVAKKMAESGQFAAIICLGAVIKGETAHFEYVSDQAAKGIASVAQETGVPTTFGVLTTYDLDQALQRAGGKEGNKGSEAALAALEMVNLLKRLKKD